MTLTVRTLDLCQLLGDVSLFAAGDDRPDMAYVHIHIGKTPIGADPSPVQVLAATATDGISAAHCMVRSDGNLRDLLLTVADAAAIVGLWQPIARAVPKEHPPHEIALTVRAAEQGRELHTVETQLLFDHAGPSLAVTAADPDEYPIDLVSFAFDPARLTTKAGRARRPHEPIRTDVAAARIGDFAKVARRRDTVMRLFRYHQDLALLVQIGDLFTGSLGPVAIDDGAQVDGPESPLVFPAAQVDTDTGDDLADDPADDEFLAQDADPDPAVSGLFPGGTTMELGGVVYGPGDEAAVEAALAARFEAGGPGATVDAEANA